MGLSVADILQDVKDLQQCLWELQAGLAADLPHDLLEDSVDEQFDQDEYAYEDGAVEINGHASHPQHPPLPHTWNQQSLFQQGEFTYASTEANDFSEDRGAEQYTVGFNPHQPACQPKMFSSQPAHPEGHFDHLQREFLDSAQNTADGEQLAQLHILNTAHQRQIKDLERDLENSRRTTRSIEHQFAIVKDEKDGLAVSLKEASRLIEQAKEREVQMQNKVNTLDQQVQALTERDHENMKKQRVAEAAVDSMKQQMLELCRSDTLSRAREQHDRDVTAIREQHERALLTLEQKLDSTSQALSQQTDVCLRLRDQVKQLERQSEAEQLERAGVVNDLTQRLQQSQKQCAQLLETGSVQETSRMQIKLQQAESAKALSENMNKVFQEDLSDLKEQITMYESALKHGVIALDGNGDLESHLSESCVDLGLKKANWKNGRLYSDVLADLSETKLPKDEALRELRARMQQCLACLKGKRQKIDQLQENLHHSQAQVDELQTQLDQAQLSSSVKLNSQVKPLDLNGASHEELKQLQEDKQHLQKQMEALEKKNSELCTRMRQMIQDLDQEKQENAERSERIQQQYRNDVVSRVRTELLQEHEARLHQLEAQHHQQVQELQTQLSEASDEMIAVQECYMAVCKEKDLLEGSQRSREREEASVREDEQKMREENSAAMEDLRTELETQYQASLNQLKALWSKEKEAAIHHQVNSQVASAKAAWNVELQKKERTWALQLKEARREKHTETAEESCQTDGSQASTVTITFEELDSRLAAQKQSLQLEADKVKHKAVKQAQRELQQKHVEEMAKQVQAAVSRAYNCQLEDLTSLPEYQDVLHREKVKWEELQEKRLRAQRVSEALRQAEEQQQERHRGQLEGPGSGAQSVEELQEEVATLQSQLEHLRAEQAALLKAELAGARTAWTRDKQQEISMVQVHSEQAYHAGLQEQHKKMEQALQQAREEAGLQKDELLLQTEALRAREEEWRGQQADRAQAHRLQVREDFLVELQTGLAELQAQLLGDPNTERQNTDQTRRTSGNAAEGTIAHTVKSSCKDIITKVVSQARQVWKKKSEETLSRALKEAQEHHEREIEKMQSSVPQRRELARCGKQCADTVGKLQKKNQELQRHLEKACRQLQQTVREHKPAMQRLKDEHEDSLRKSKEDHQLQLEELKRSKEASGRNLQLGLEEMQQQCMTTVEKIRGDVVLHLQRSRQRAAEMIRVEVQKERHNTARKMRHYYLSSLQELLQDAGLEATGAEKIIMNAASKMAAMAKVLETPVKRKSGKSHSLPGSSTAVYTGNTPGQKAASRKNPSTAIQTPEIRVEERTHRETTHTGSEHQVPAAARTNPLSKASHQDIPLCGVREASEEAHPPSHKPARVGSVSLRNKSRELYLQEGESGRADDRLDSERPNKHFLIHEAPVREERRSDWSLSSSDSNTDFPVSTLSYLGKEVEPAKPFSLSAASGSAVFGSLLPDTSDLTVYNGIAKTASHTRTWKLPGAMSAHREPIPGSEGEKQHRVGPKVLFSELRHHQQDSGFNSPLYQQK